MSDVNILVLKVLEGSDRLWFFRNTESIGYVVVLDNVLLILKIDVALAEFSSIKLVLLLGLIDVLPGLHLAMLVHIERNCCGYYYQYLWTWSRMI